MRSFLSILAFAAALVEAAILPAADPFYVPPTGFESQAPGTVLRSRLIAPALFGILIQPLETWQLLYRTNSVNGSAIAGVTTVFKPALSRNDRFVSFQTAYDASSTSCEPSYTYQFGSSQLDLLSSLEQILLQAYLLEGYIVSSADYEGPEAAWTAGRLSGTGVLDSMRAVQNFGSKLGLTTTSPKIVCSGYSGGAIATGWAAQLQSSYAPELNVVGWAAGGTPANLTGIVGFLDDAFFSGFLPVAIDGLLKPTAYGAELAPVLDKYVTAAGQAQLQYCNSVCGIECVLKYPYESISSDNFSTLGQGLLYEPTVARIIAENTLGLDAKEIPTTPVLLYHAKQDEVAPYTDAQALAASWCADGASVQFTTYAAGGHITTEILGFIQAIQFAQSAFSGTVKSGCSTNTVLGNALNPLALGLNLEPLLFQLLGVLHTLGTNDQNLFKNPNILANQA